MNSDEATWTCGYDDCEDPAILQAAEVVLCRAHLAAAKRTWDALLEFVREQTVTAPDEVRDPVVYYVRRGDLVKIGTTVDLNGRLSALQVVDVLATEPGSYEVEARRHQQFKHLRVRGEWFAPTPELMAHIDGLRDGVPEADDRTSVRDDVCPACIKRDAAHSVSAFQYEGTGSVQSALSSAQARAAAQAALDWTCEECGDPVLMDLDMAAILLGCSRDTVRGMHSRGQLVAARKAPPGERRGARRNLYRPADILALKKRVRSA